MTFNVLEYARQAADPDRLLVQPRGLRRRPPVRGLRRARRRLRLHGEHVLGVEDRRRGVRLLVRALLRPPLPRLPLLQRLRPLRQRPAPDGARHPALHPLDARGEPITIYGGRDKTLDFTYVDDCVDGITRGIEALAAGRVVNQTINLAYGEGNTLVHCAERIAHELGVEPDMTLAPSLLGEVTHYVADLSKARSTPRLRPTGSARRGNRPRGRLVPGAPRGPSGGGRLRPRGPRARAGGRLEDGHRAVVGQMVLPLRRGLRQLIRIPATYSRNASSSRSFRMIRSCVAALPQTLAHLTFARPPP